MVLALKIVLFALLLASFLVIVSREINFQLRYGGSMGRRKKVVEADENQSLEAVEKELTPQEQLKDAVDVLEDAFKDACQDAQVACKHKLAKAIKDVIALSQGI